MQSITREIVLTADHSDPYETHTPAPGNVAPRVYVITIRRGVLPYLAKAQPTRYAR
jgi:hypothetical protein